MPRASTGPLSAASLSTLRCPTRRDFLQNPPSNVQVGEDSEEVPAYLTPRLLDAMDRLESSAELQAIVMWLDDVRAERGFELCVSDMDLSNGVALLDALYVIDCALFQDVEYEGATDVPNSYVCRELDREGVAAGKNIAMLRTMLQKVEWKEDAKVLKGVDFEKIDVWALGGFVLVAAYVCERAAEFIRLMVGYDEWVQNCLEDVVCRGLKTLGGGEGLSPRSVSSGVTRESSLDGMEQLRKRVEELEARLAEEKKRRAEMGRQVERERRRAEQNERERKRLEEAVKKEKKGAPVPVGVMQQLRLENSRLRKENARLRRQLQGERRHVDKA